jgi:CRISPR-associated protein Cas5t
MNYLTVQLHARMASFRDPEFQNFHHTLPLPPPTTCLGIAGAALGMTGPELQSFFAPGAWELGIAGDARGKAKDLWKFVKDTKKGDRDIINREYLYDCDFFLVFGHADLTLLDRLEDAFRAPVYTLTCGNSDSLCRVVALNRSDQCIKSAEVAACYAPGDLLGKTIDSYVPGKELSISTSSTPVAKALPLRYEYLKDGVRMLRERKTLSYVRYLVSLESEVRGIIITIKPTYGTPEHNSLAERFIPVFSI